MSNTKYLGFRQKDFAASFSKFYDENVAPVKAEILTSMQVKISLPSLAEAAQNLTQNGHNEYETGYELLPNGEQRVAVLTTMHDVTPPMWSWWFGWHGCRDNRYKLWHPKAHVAAAWQDRKDDTAYIGRTSQIQEYIGETLEKANIRFFEPTELNFSEKYIADNEEVAVICARLGLTTFPLDFGYLIHQIRKTEQGAEMRSRFFMGGEHIAIRSNSFFAKSISKLLQKYYRLPEQQAIDLLTHCSEEMNHLAKVLPKLYQEENKKP